jgi:hypoxanthine phosphoribosyltransferase
MSRTTFTTPPLSPVPQTGAAETDSPLSSTRYDSPGPSTDAAVSAESSYSAPAVAGNAGIPSDLVSPRPPQGTVKLFARPAAAAGDAVRACTAQQFWSKRDPKIWSCRINDGQLAVVLTRCLEEIRSTLTPEEHAYVRAVAHAQVSNDPFLSFQLFRGLGDFASVRRLVRMLPHDCFNDLKFRAMLLLEEHEAAFSLADALPKGDCDLDMLIDDLKNPLYRHIESYAARRGVEMHAHFSLYQTASDLIALSGDYDVFIAIARGGLFSGAMADVLGFPTIVMEVHAHGRRRPTSRWLDVAAKESIEGKRVLLLDKDAITGASVMEAVKRLARYRPAGIGIYLNISPPKPSLGMTLGTTGGAVEKIEAAGIAVHHPENVRRMASKEVVERFYDRFKTSRSRLRGLERAFEDEVFLVAQTFAPDEVRKLRDALAERKRFFHSLNPMVPGVTAVRDDIVKNLESLLQIYRDGLPFSDGGTATSRDEAGPLAVSAVERYVAARHRRLQRLNREIVGIVRDVESLRDLDEELKASGGDKMAIGRRLHAALSRVLPGVVQRLNALEDASREVAAAKEEALGLTVVASREQLVLIGKEIHQRSATSLQRYAEGNREFYEALEKMLPALAEKCASLLAMQRDLDGASRRSREERVELRAKLYTALEELPALAGELQAMLTIYREAIAPDASRHLGFLAALATASASPLPVGFADVLANARYLEAGRRCASDRNVKHEHLPRSYTVAFRAAMDAVQEVGYDTALIVGPEGFAYEPIFRDLGLAIAAVNIPEAVFNGERSLKELDDLSKLKGSRVLVVEDDVVSGATLRKLLPSLERHAPAELGLFLGSPSGRQLQMNIPASFRHVHISDDKVNADGDADADAFLRHLAEREVIFKDGLPDWWKK